MPANLPMIFYIIAITTTFTTLILAPATTTTLTALPPGYEDEILCHPALTSCLHPRPRPRGWCGPRTAFVECCDAQTGAVSRPRGWGYKLEAEYKEELLRQGWGVAAMCGVDEARVCDSGGGRDDRRVARRLVVSEMEEVVDRLVVLGVSGVW